MFNHVSAIVLFVQDFDSCLRFYRDALGLPVGLLQEKFVGFKMKEQDFALLHISAGAEMINVGVEAFEAQTGKLDRVLLCADIDDVDAAYETLKARGVEFTKAPVDQPWGYRAAYFRDPEGNIWEIRQPLEKK